MRSPDSAVRFANENWEVLAQFDASSTVVPSTLTPRAQAVPFARGYDRAAVTAWPGNFEELATEFAEARDSKNYTDRDHRDFARRATWLYPYDGCASRGAHMARQLRARGLPRPTKLFAFGNLRTKTAFQRGGTVFWWYHTAPAYRLGETTWVLDPSVEAKSPIRLEDWLGRMSARPEAIKLAVCDGNSFNAQSICRGGAEDQDREHEANIRGYLPLEWKNVETLGYDPKRLLGEEPPWLIEPIRETVEPKIKDERCEPLAAVASKP